MRLNGWFPVNIEWKSDCHHVVGSPVAWWWGVGAAWQLRLSVGVSMSKEINQLLTRCL